MPRRHFSDFVNNVCEKFGEWPDEIKDKYFYNAFYFRSDGEARMECIFPKEHDENVVSILSELKKKQDDFLKELKDGNNDA